MVRLKVQRQRSSLTDVKARVQMQGGVKNPLHHRELQHGTSRKMDKDEKNVLVELKPRMNGIMNPCSLNVK